MSDLHEVRNVCARHVAVGDLAAKPMGRLLTSEKMDSKRFQPTSRLGKSTQQAKTRPTTVSCVESEEERDEVS